MYRSKIKSMRKYCNYILLASLFFLISCYDLDRTPAEQISSATFWKTQEQFDEGMMGVYAQLKEYYAKSSQSTFGDYFLNDIISDICTGYDQYPSDVVRGNLYAGNYFAAAKWKGLYEGVARANTVIQNIPNSEIEEEIKEQYLGEAKFLRALYYFHLWDFFGGVPLYDENTIYEKDYAIMMKPRSSTEETCDFILRDLDAAISVLPDVWDGENKGRATSNAAISLKGKVLLYVKKYAEAATEFEKVVNSGLHELYPDYAGLFRPDEGDESSEMIFAIQNKGGATSEYGMPLSWLLGNQSSFGSGWNNMMVTNELVDSYEWVDGRPFDWNEVISNYNESLEVRESVYRVSLTSDNTKVEKYPKEKEILLAMYDQRDPRMKATVILPYTIYKGWDGAAEKDCEYVMTDNMAGLVNTNGFVRPCNSYENYLFRKFVSEYDFGGLITSRNNTPMNFPLIRYADVLLMLAECYNEMGMLDQAVALINQVRKRVKMPGINSGSIWLEARTKEEIFERIKHERAVEFVGEGLRYSDLRRWNLLSSINGKQNLTITGLKSYYTCVIKDYYSLFPIPSNEIYQNPLLDQNPGY